MCAHLRKKSAYVSTFQFINVKCLKAQRRAEAIDYNNHQVNRYVSILTFQHISVKRPNVLKTAESIDYNNHHVNR